MSQYKRYDYYKLYELCERVFKAVGYSDEDSHIITDVLLTSDRFGIESHGVQRLIMYMQGLKNGRINKNAHSFVVRETPVSAVMDGDDGMGQLVSNKAMQMAIDKAAQSGIGMVVVRNSCHYGIAGYYSRKAAEQGFLGISMTNTEGLVVPTFGRHKMLGTNPIAVSMPATPNMFHMDMSTAVVPAGKMEVYDKIGKKTPEGWFVNPQGQPATDPHEFILIRRDKTDGGLLTLGGFGELHSGHKGFGFSLLVELLCGSLSGGYNSPDVRRIPNIEKCCHMFMAIDYGMFDDKKAIEDRFSAYLQSVRDSEKAEGCPRIYIHGDKEMDNEARVLREGALVNEATSKEIIGICEELGVDYGSLLREVK